MKTYHFFKLWRLLGLIGLGFLMWGSLTSREIKISIPIYQDKFMHFFVYAFASYYFLILYSNKKLAIVLKLFFYSCLLEILQALLTDHREAEVLDILANALGLIVGAIMSAIFSNSLMIIDRFLFKLEKAIFK